MGPGGHGIRSQFCLRDSVQLSRSIAASGVGPTPAGTAFRGTRPGPAGIRFRVRRYGGRCRDRMEGRFFLQMKHKPDNEEVKELMRDCGWPLHAHLTLRLRDEPRTRSSARSFSTMLLSSVLTRRIP